MQQVEIIINQILMLGMLGLTGFLAGRSEYLPKNAGIVLSRIVIKLTAPILILTTMTNYSFTRKNLIDGLWIFTYGIVFILLAFIISSYVSRIFKLESRTNNIYVMLSMFGNVIFLAYPLLNSLYGEKGIIYAIFYNLANDAVLWTLGIYLVNKHNTAHWKDNLRHLVNANSIAFILGIVSILINLQHHVNQNHFVKTVYTLFFNTFNPLGKTTIYLSMLFIGLILSEVKLNGFKDILKRYPIFILSIFKLFLIPITAVTILTLMKGFVDPFVKVIVVLQLGMPCATIVPALASQYESDYKFATESVFFSTLLGLVTLPFIVYLLQIFA